MSTLASRISDRRNVVATCALVCKSFSLEKTHVTITHILSAKQIIDFKRAQKKTRILLTALMTLYRILEPKETLEMIL